MGQITGRLHKDAKPVVGRSTGQRTVAIFSGEPTDFDIECVGVDLVTMANFSELTPERFTGWEADMVLSPLFSSEFDCHELAERLTSLGFSGQYRAVATWLPNPGLVKREIRARFPGLDFDIILMNSQTTKSATVQ